jgi:hypothetical protein
MQDSLFFVFFFFSLLFVTPWEIIVTLKFKGHQRAEMMWDVGVGRGGVSIVTAFIVLELQKWREADPWCSWGS